jgi:hypothetical protein
MHACCVCVWEGGGGRGGRHARMSENQRRHYRQRSPPDAFLQLGQLSGRTQSARTTGLWRHGVTHHMQIIPGATAAQVSGSQLLARLHERGPVCHEGPQGAGGDHCGWLPLCIHISHRPLTFLTRCQPDRGWIPLGLPAYTSCLTFRHRASLLIFGASGARKSL